MHKPFRGYAADHLPMLKVSRDNPAYWLTSVIHNRLSIFQRDDYKKIITDAYNEARERHKL